MDKGTGFYNILKLKKLLTEHKIKIYSKANEKKCSVVERWNQDQDTAMEIRHSKWNTQIH